MPICHYGGLGILRDLFRSIYKSIQGKRSRNKCAMTNFGASQQPYVIAEGEACPRSMDCFANARNDEKKRFFGFHPQNDIAKKAAFTLAEVLITLGIIGVVAAMTLPTVINNTRNKQLETALKKSYSALSQVTMRVINEDFGGYLDANSAYMLKDYFVKYYNGSKVCVSNDRPGGCPPAGTSVCDFMVQNYKNFTGKVSAACVGNDALTNTIDGTTVYFDTPNWNADVPESVAGKIIIVIDVNGWQKRPNMLGHDMFMFQITDKGKLLPMGANDNDVYPADEYCSLTSNTNTNGYGCAAKALLDKDYFKNLPK